jgi:hypothetical protein
MRRSRAGGANRSPSVDERYSAMPSARRAHDVGESQRADRMLVPERHGASMSSADGHPVLEHADRLEPERDAEPRRREARGVRARRSGSCRSRAPTRGLGDEHAVGGVAAHDLDERRRGHGLKKCMPRNRSGRSSRAASWSIEIDDVFEASAAPAAAPPRRG